MIACYGIMCPKHQICQRYEDVETSSEVTWQATCDTMGDGKLPGFLSRVAPPPMVNKLEGHYVPERGAPQRNDGHKGIKSKGTLC